MSDRDHIPEYRPTPERGWIWRRLFSFLSSAALFALMWLVIRRVTNDEALRAIALMLTGILALDRLLYLGGATLTDIWRLVSAVRTTRTVTRTESKS